MSVSIVIVLALTGTWCLIRGEFNVGEGVLGVVFSTAFVLLSGAGQGRRVPVAELPRRGLYLALYLFVLLPYDLVQSNLDMARRLLHHEPLLRPGIVRFELGKVVDLSLAIEEHGITMTPGQAVIDYAADRQTIYIHVIDIEGVEGKQERLWRRQRDVLQKVFE